MKAEITLSQLNWNPSVMNFFFRRQSINTFKFLIEKAIDTDTLFSRIEDMYDDLDDFEEFLYDESDEVIIEKIGTEYFR